MACPINEITPYDVRGAWVQQVLEGAQAQDSPLSLYFFSPENVEFVRSEIERRLRLKLEEPNIKYVMTQEFAQSMVDMALNNQGWAYDVEGGLPRLNQWVINKEVEIAYLGQRQHRRYETQMLQGNRMRVFPYGLGDKTLHVRGENQLTQAPYQLNHPFRSQYDAFLNQVLHIHDKDAYRDSLTRASTCNNFRPRYPTP